MRARNTKSRTELGWIIGVGLPGAIICSFLAMSGGCETGQSTDSSSKASHRQDPAPDSAVASKGPAVAVSEVVQPKISTDPVLSRSQHPSGVVIEDLKMGQGQPLLPGGVMVFRHRGFVQADGTCFEDSYKSDRPIEMAYSQAPKRLQAGMPGMRVGGIRRLIVPPALAFAERGVPKEEGEGFKVPPNATIVYEIELVELRQRLPGEASPPAPAAPPAPKVPAAEASETK